LELQDLSAGLGAQAVLSATRGTVFTFFCLIAHLQRYAACGCRRITFRISTMGDPMAQLRRLVEEVLPYV
jgi:hypothetical protein